MLSRTVCKLYQRELRNCFFQGQAGGLLGSLGGADGGGAEHGTGLIQSRHQAGPCLEES